MASIQKSAEKGYRIYWRLYFPDGTYREKYKVSKTKTLLQTILPDVMKIEELSRRQQLTGEDIAIAINLKILQQDDLPLLAQANLDPTTHYLEELRPEYETKSKAEAGSPHAHKDNLSKANMLETYFKGIPLRDISQERIKEFTAHRRKKLANTTVNHDLKALRKYLDIAVSKHWLDENVARKITLLREEKNRIPRCLYPAELTTFFDKLKEMSHLLHGDIQWIMAILIFTGLRRSELIKLSPDNIKLHLRQIHILGKGQKHRIVGINHDLLKEFDLRVKKGTIIPPGLNESSISHAFKKVIRAAKLSEDLTLHSLRHTYISYMLQTGAPISTVRDRAGHFSVEITNNYTHALPQDQTEEDLLSSRFPKIDFH